MPIAISGIGGAFSVVAANSWMNQPQGFTLDAAGKVAHVAPLKVLFNPATVYEVPHMFLAAYMVTGFLVASVYAVGMLKGRRDRYHRLGLAIPFAIAAIATPIQLFVGDTAARDVADHQPAKFAGMECVYKSGDDQAEHVGGICTQGGQVKGDISIPGLDSLLVGFSTGTKVKGLDSFPADRRPPLNTMLHLCFDAMVGIGTALLGLGLWFGIAWVRRRELPRSVWFLRATAVSGIAAIAALECRLDRDRGRAPAVDRLRDHAHQGGRDGRAGVVVHLRAHAGPLHRAGRRHRAGAAEDRRALARGR